MEKERSICCSETAIGARVGHVETPICLIILSLIITLRSNSNNALLSIFFTLNGIELQLNVIKSFLFQYYR